MKNELTKFQLDHLERLKRKFPEQFKETKNFSMIVHVLSLLEEISEGTKVEKMKAALTNVYLKNTNMLQVAEALGIKGEELEKPKRFRNEEADKSEETALSKSEGDKGFLSNTEASEGARSMREGIENNL